MPRPDAHDAEVDLEDVALNEATEARLSALTESLVTLRHVVSHALTRSRRRCLTSALLKGRRTRGRWCGPGD